MPSTFAGKTVLMSGGSRGIGLAIALRLAQDGANVALLAKTDVAHPRLPGTIHTAAQALREAGGVALPIVGDVRDEVSVAAAVAQTAEHFGGIDIVINNASAIDLTPTTSLPAKRYDLMFDVNARGTYLLSSLTAPYLARSENARVLTLSPPLNLDQQWLATHAAYTASKYTMTMLTLGLAETGRADGIAANCLWPRTMIDTAAVRNVVASSTGHGQLSTRTPGIMADAAYVILSKSADFTGQTLIDEDVLRADGVDDFSGYLAPGATEEALEPDLFV